MSAKVRRSLGWLHASFAACAVAACSSASPDVGNADGVELNDAGAVALPSSPASSFEAGIPTAFDASSPTPPDAQAAHDAAAPPDPAIEGMHLRADQALATLMLAYWPTLAANTTTYDWMYAHYWDAVLDAAERRGPNAFAGTAKMFYELQARRGWLDGFYDDENWITLALLHAYKVTGDSTYLSQAKVVYADIMKAWDTSCCLANPGGLWWEKPTTNKVTAINAGAVVSASRLYEATKDDTYLTFGKQVFAYWSTYMVDATTGHVYDGMDNAGTINTAWNFTYNEGLFIGAVVELAKATGDSSHLPLAHLVASFMLSKESETTAEGTILSDGNCGGDGDMFKGIGARYLGELYAVDPTHTEYLGFLSRSGDAAWTLARDPSTGNISCDWKGPYDATTGVVGSLGSAAVGLAAAAVAMGPGAQRPALQYEAEEGDLHGVGLEAIYAGFTGWGYLAGWGADAQSVDLLVDAPAAGKYQLAFRYADGSDATRVLSVNGQSLESSFTFPSTDGYATYGTIATSAQLTKGANTITLAFTAAEGSSGYLNLDALQLTAQ